MAAQLREAAQGNPAAELMEQAANTLEWRSYWMVFTGDLVVLALDVEVAGSMHDRLGDWVEQADLVAELGQAVDARRAAR